MNHKPQNPLLRWLGSTQFTLVLLAIFAVAIAVATFLEVRFGTTGARVMVYDALWFEVMLGLIVVNLILSLIFHFPYQIRQTGFVITHIGFIVVVTAAGITRFWGYEGNMPIREGHSTDYIYSVKDYVSLSAGGDTAAFPVALFAGGRNAVSRTLSIGGEAIHVSVDEYLPHAGTNWVEGSGGRPALLYTTSEMQRGQQDILLRDESFKTRGVTVRFAAEDRKMPPAPSRFGELVVHFDGEVKRMPVQSNLSGSLLLNGHRFRVTEIAPNFRVGENPSIADPMNNPAIRVEVQNPAGETGERLLFAYHPDFDMGHSGKASVFEDINMLYTLERRLDLFPDGDGLAGRADFPVQLDPRGEAAQDTTSIAPGERFSVQPGAIIRSGGFALVVNKTWQSAVKTMVASNDTDAPSAVRLSLTSDGSRTTAVVPHFDDPVDVDLGGKNFQVAYGPEIIQLPYRLHLDDFVLITYPGSDNPASFESHVRIFDDERGVDGRPARIYMNNPLSYRGFKHFQSSYDRDRLGTVLSVNHDPGKLPTYLGYALIGFGFLVTLTRGIWYRPAAARRRVS